MKRVVITGADGLLGRELISAFGAVSDDVVGLGRHDVDLTKPETVTRISRLEPELVVNSAAWTDVDGCARQPQRAIAINGVGAGLVARAAADAGAFIVQVSTNEVFAGDEHEPYREERTPNPVNPYGTSKLAGEAAVARATGRYLVIRTAWLYGPRRGFPARIRTAERALAPGESLRVVDDEWGNPTPAHRLAPAIVHATMHALSDGVPKILHLAGEPPTSRHDWALMVIGGQRKVERIKRRDYPRASTVPERAVLSMESAHALGIGPIGWQDDPQGSAG